MRIARVLLLTLFAACKSAPSLTIPESKVPGVVVDYISATTRQYIGSPGLAVLPDGICVASHDFFGPGSTRDKTVVFRSADRGKTWEQKAEITGQWWSTLFVHKGALYLMGTSREYGNCVIRRSSDGGRTWTTPNDANTGLLFGDGKYHCAPVPVVIHNGRLWRAMEDADGPGGWGTRFRSFMMSAPVDADLLRADSWTSSNRLGVDTKLLDGRFHVWLEGNAVVTPDGKIVNLLRVDDSEYPEKIARVEISEDGKTASFDSVKGFLEFPGGAKKFTIRFDPKSKLYWSLVNCVPDSQKGIHPAKTRNTLALAASKDLVKWDVRCVLIHHPEREKHGFQYVEWHFDDDDIIALIRTAFDDDGSGAHNAHDANYLVFRRFPNFRKLRMEDSVGNIETAHHR